jgi:hypothetical protein
MRVHYDSDHKEYNSRLFRDGRPVNEGYFTDDKQDAIDTANFEANRLISPGGKALRVRRLASSVTNKAPTKLKYVPDVTGWIIKKDHLGMENVLGPKYNRVSVIGPRRIAPETRARLLKGEGQKFRMLDGDGQVYYEGLCIEGKDASGLFAPLENFGTPDSGCTDIQYWNGGWKSL